MTQWQHAFLTVDPMKPEDITKLESYGKDGWECVSVLPWSQSWQLETMAHVPGDAEHGTVHTGGPGTFLMFFKRAIQEAGPNIPGYTR